MVLSTLFEANFNAFPIGNCLLSPTLELTILAVNNAFLKGCGRRREDLVGVSLFEAFPGNPADPNESGEVALRSSIARVMATGQPDTLPVQRYPILVEQDNGEARYEERIWSAVNTPVFGEDGRILCVSHSTTDVTELVRSEAAIKESDIRFRALVNAASDVIYRMSPDWKYMHELDGREFLKTTTRLAEYRIEEYVYPDDLDLAKKAIDEAIRNKTVFELEHRVLRANGGYGWTYSKAVPILDDEGNIREWVGMASDITERKEVEERLKEASKRKDEFLAMLAHELRNPLAPIGAAAALLEMATLDEARVRQTSQIISRQVGHMAGLIDDLLDVSRVSRGLVELDSAILDIGQIIADAVEQITPLLKARRHYLSLHLAPGTALVLGDRKRLVQILANVLNNAAKYTPEGGRIALTTQIQPSQVLLEVSDNGIGMAPELVSHAFDLFTQAERTSDRSSGGLGLGLALVKNLVELHGGTVACASDGVGKGSTFTIGFPRVLDTTDQSSQQEHANDLPKATNPLRIMVVDDNADAASMLAMLLETVGHQVIIEHDSRRALERARSEVPDVCLLDIGLPDMDGNELAQRLRARSETANCLLVAITGYGQADDRKSTSHAGFDHHLVKPVNTTALNLILSKIKAT